jgi:hypothetical protein
MIERNTWGREGLKKKEKERRKREKKGFSSVSSGAWV